MGIDRVPWANGQLIGTSAALRFQQASPKISDFDRTVAESCQHDWETAEQRVYTYEGCPQ